MPGIAIVNSVTEAAPRCCRLAASHCRQWSLGVVPPDWGRGQGEPALLLHERIALAGGTDQNNDWTQSRCMLQTSSDGGCETKPMELYGGADVKPTNRKWVPP